MPIFRAADAADMPDDFRCCYAIRCHFSATLLRLMIFDDAAFADAAAISFASFRRRRCYCRHDATRC